MTVPPALFLAGGGSTADVRDQKETHSEYMLFFEALTNAVKYAWDQWRGKAWFEGLAINGPTATAGAGCLKGPSIEKLTREAEK
jgi:hypothetical protein